MSTEFLQTSTTPTTMQQQKKSSTQLNQAFNKPVPISKSKYTQVVDINSKKSASILDSKQHPFRSLVGRLLYANICTRPDISFALSTLATHNSDPRTMHWNALLDLLRYLRDTSNIKLTYGKLSSSETPNVISVYADADFSQDKTRKSRTGYVIFLNGGPIAWNSSLQTTIAQSTSESELYALMDAVNNALQIKHILQELGYPQGTIQCYEDNSGLLDWIQNGRTTTRMKHIELKYIILKDHHTNKTFQFNKIQTELQRADLLTKQMDYAIFSKQIQYKCSTTFKTVNTVCIYIIAYILFILFIVHPGLSLYIY